jgi:hypothetical protein
MTNLRASMLPSFGGRQVMLGFSAVGQACCRVDVPAPSKRRDPRAQLDAEQRRDARLSGHAQRGDLDRR